MKINSIGAIAVLCLLAALPACAHPIQKLVPLPVLSSGAIAHNRADVAREIAFVGAAKSLLFSAPSASSVGSGYPWAADNATDIWADSGPATVLTAPIIGTTAGSPNVLIAATAGKKVRVIGVVLTNAIAGTVQFVDTEGSPVNLSGVLTLAANGQFTEPINKYGYMDVAAGYGLNINVTGSSNIVGGTITYYLH